MFARKCVSDMTTCGPFSPCGWDRCRCVCLRKRERQRQSEIVLMHTLCMPLFVYVLTFHSPGISEMPAGSSASCLPTTHPSIHPSIDPRGMREKNPSGIWALPEMLTSTVNGCVGCVGVMMVIIQQGSRRIMSLMKESCRSGMSTLAYWVQSAWVLEEILRFDCMCMGSENLVVSHSGCASKLRQKNDYGIIIVAMQKNVRENARCLKMQDW